jgi:putative membrane-bound dehydrogenase-like protein
VRFPAAIKPFVFRRFFFLLLLILFACNAPESARNTSDFTLLPEADKRLPENALMAMKVVDGLSLELFASEPMVTNPTNMSVDNLGRVWVCEAYNYDVGPDQEDKMGDRIIVLEDTDHDGKADKRTVFYQGTDITTPLGIMVLGSEVYVTRSPNILKFTDVDGDLVADRKDTLYTNLGSPGDHSAHALFPGPDGNLYFSMGNYAGEVHDVRGNVVRDKSGIPINQSGKPYIGGMVLRFAEGTGEMEVLGHNFRNNYEPCISSYGTIWQSDNDDDGNESCRINYVMQYGNFGYLDEMTRASWGTNRINMEEVVQRRHWHQNDPGVVPNVLVTGAGSPAGMTVYEGDVLPETLHGAPVHAEPYYNVVRSYIPSPDGAGYTARIENVLSSQDQWFRPIDVSVAGDGSLFVADWYDPILGGGAAGDANRGRIYRVASKARYYEVPVCDFSSVDGAISALASPNSEARYMAHRALRNFGSEALAPLRQLWESNKPVMRVRAMWLLAAQLREDFLKEALSDKNPEIRVSAVRATQQLLDSPVPLLSSAASDTDVSVRREVAIALRYVDTREGAQLWTALAKQYDGTDRWYLEALGIGADLHTDRYFDHWISSVTPDLRNKAHRDIFWRIRSEAALPYLVEIIRQSADTSLSLPFFRAFDFHHSAEKNTLLASLLNLSHTRHKKIAVLALQQMDASQLALSPAIQRALREALRETAGTTTFIDLVKKFSLRGETAALISLASSRVPSLGSSAVDVLIRFEQEGALQKALMADDSIAINLLLNMSGKGNRTIQQLVSDIASDSKRSLVVRQTATHTLGSSWPGEERLLTLVKEKALDTALYPIAASILFNVYRTDIQREAARYLPRPETNGIPIPTIKELLASRGDPDKGTGVFQVYCAVCHRIGSQGNKFGPELSSIGSKMSADGLYRAIIYPSDGISHGYESTIVTMKDNAQVMGIVSSETDTEISLLLPGGSVNRIAVAEIAERKIVAESLMPGLAGVMSHQELIDLVRYLSTLKSNE